MNHLICIPLFGKQVSQELFWNLGKPRFQRIPNHVDENSQLRTPRSWLSEVYFGVGKASDIVYDNFPQWATKLIFMLCIYVCITVHMYSP